MIVHFSSFFDLVSAERNVCMTNAPFTFDYDIYFTEEIIIKFDLEVRTIVFIM